MNLDPLKFSTIYVLSKRLKGTFMKKWMAVFSERHVILFKILKSKFLHSLQ